MDDKIEQKNKMILYEWLKTICIVILVVTLGVFMINQILEYRYRSAFLQDPCGLCVSLEGNEHLEPCFVSNSQINIDPNTGEPIEDLGEWRKENSPYQVNYSLEGFDFEE